MLKTFPRGVHPVHAKSFTDKLNIEIMPPPKMLYISLGQRDGKSAAATVKVGDNVKKGQLIGKADGMGLNVFSSCCGTVKAIEERAIAGGKALHVVIENNFSNDNAHFKPLNNPAAEDILDRIAQAGIGGMGGAGFPTAVKLKTSETINELIINAAECEPYITCDHRIMLEYTNKFMGGALLMQKACGAKRIIIGIEVNKSDAIATLNDYITANKTENVTVMPLKAKYPQGSEKQLIYAATGKKITKGARSSSFGVLVVNVHTAFSVYLAVNEGWPSYSRVMTVSGGGIREPKNVWVSNGTTFEDIIQFCGGYSDKEAVKIISGGPMMGIAVYNTSVSTVKTTSCLLLLTKDECFTGKSSQCINCGKCALVCPMKLMPMYIDSMCQSGFYAETERYGVNYCIECGCCAYICPAKRTLVQSIVFAKKKLREAGKK